MNEEKSLPSTSINWYPGHMEKTKRRIKEMLSLIDVVYELIDARIPYSSKIKDIEDVIKNKPRILIMTKKDLCDLSVTEKWVKYYEEKGYIVLLVDLKNDHDYKMIIETTHNITNDIQLFEYFSKVKYTKNNIFTSKNNMKKNYITNYIISIAMTSGKSITKINFRRY